jgi:Ca2+-binding EF-hand superfamily protein
LAKLGYTGFTPKILANSESIVDVEGAGEIQFGAFLWFFDMLTHAVTLFNGKAANGRVASTEVGNFLSSMGYANLAPRTVTALQTLTDPTHSGGFDFNSFVTTLLFIRFALNLFGSADSEGKGHLTFQQLEGLLPNLNIHGASPQQAKAIFDAHDLDKSGTMDPFEFIDLALALKFPQLAQH